MKKGVTWFLMTALIATVFLSAGGCAPSGGAAPSSASVAPAPVVTIETNKGIIKFVAYPDVAPNTVKNFVTLAQKGFYDGLTWHRVVEGFVIQGGDPNGNGSGGPGYSIKAEFGSRKHLDGTVAMARSSDPDSAGSQFYICLADQPGLDGKYTVFGQVTEGLDVVHQIAVGDTIIKVTVANADNYPAPEVIK
ncbi:MAG: peptidylprolyl isomerase [Coprothermobacterota bacterium]|jgi:peptidylprolyl isomerase/peptidyl-prolyl cis-trans isomerase B (cyclophilin B)|nr:peptidylprolyl isomerase [Coprothermobacterota bacterium]